MKQLYSKRQHQQHWNKFHGQWSNHSRYWTVIRYNTVKRFPFIIWPLRLASLLFLISIIFAILLIASIEMGFFGKLPDRPALAGITNYLASEVLADDHSVLGRYYIENRSNVAYHEISPHFINALISTEDARFFQHTGVDVRSWLRVLFKTIILKDRSSGGGSTLSQQLAKNLYPREDYPFGPFSIVINKLREVLVARRIELLYTKKEVLELYLNTVSFSENTFGIKVAAQRFFNTSPARLNSSESATLVAMLKAPSTYDPIRKPIRSRERRDLVLQQMAEYGFISLHTADSLQKEPLCLEHFPLDHDYGPATYFREHLRLEVKKLLKGLRKQNGMAFNLYTDGLKIYTTIDPKLQRYAQQAVRKHISELQRSFDEHLQGANPWEVERIPKISKLSSERYRNLQKRGVPENVIDSIFNIPIEMKVFSWEHGQERVKMSPMDSIHYYLGLLNAGMLAMEPNTGRIKAWVGGIDYQYFKYDHVKSHRQVGSTFKPVVYATALQQGIAPCSYTLNTLRTYPQYNYWTPKNAGHKYGGYFSMEGGLINSINTVTVNLAMRSKPRNVARLAEQLGISGTVPRRPAIALGAIEASLMEMVTIYGTFANRGLRPKPHYIKRIETPDGQVLINYEYLEDSCNWEQPLSTAQADMINQMLRSAIDRGTGRRLRFRYELSNDLAGKTGTSQNHSDGWFMGYTPGLVTGVWVGAESPGVRFRNLRLGQGANTALPIYGLFVQKLNADPLSRQYVQTTFPTPADTVLYQLNCPNIQYPNDKPVDTLASKKPLALNPVLNINRPVVPTLHSPGTQTEATLKLKGVGKENNE